METIVRVTVEVFVPCFGDPFCRSLLLCVVFGLWLSGFSAVF